MISRQRSLRAIARAQERMDTLAPDTATGPAAETQAEQQVVDDTDEILRAKKAEDEQREKREAACQEPVHLPLSSRPDHPIRPHDRVRRLGSDAQPDAWTASSRRASRFQWVAPVRGGDLTES